MEVIMIPISSVISNPFQPRTRFEDETLYDLAELDRFVSKMQSEISGIQGSMIAIVASLY